MLGYDAYFYNTILKGLYHDTRNFKFQITLTSL